MVNPTVFFDITADGEPLGRVSFEPLGPALLSRRAGGLPTIFPEPLPFSGIWAETLPKVSRTKARRAAICRQSSKDSRKLSCSEHWRERIWIQGFLLSQNYPRIHVPGW